MAPPLAVIVAARYILSPFSHVKAVPESATRVWVPPVAFTKGMVSPMARVRGCGSAEGSPSCSVQAAQSTNRLMPHMPSALYRVCRIYFFIVMLFFQVRG